MVVSERYDVEVEPTARAVTGAVGRHVVAVIGIDRYHHWPSLSNAVRDANGAAALFRRLGFEEVTAPLLDDRATGKAIQSLVTDDLMTLGSDDSLVLFYAGHGGTRKHHLGDDVIKAGYLIPVDAAVSPDKASTWVDLEGWLRAVSLLPARHILVVLDACHSGIALDPIIKWRDIGAWQDAPLPALQARRSRRIITSALDDQVALDSGPMHGHSLFTGCLLEGLTGGIRSDKGAVTTGSELGLYVQRRVQTYPSSRQTPDFGTFALDDRGEMAIPLAIERAPERPEEPAMAASPPAWLDLIDLDDRPERALATESRSSDASSAAGVEASDKPSTLAAQVPAPPGGSDDKPAPALDAEPRTNDSASGSEAEGGDADGPQPVFADPSLVRPYDATSIASTRELAEPASAALVPPPTSRPRRRRHSTPVLPLLLPSPETVAPAVPTPGARRGIVIGAIGAALAAVLIGYFVFGSESPPVDPRVDPPAPAATPGLPDARSVDAGLGPVLDALPDAPSQPVGSPAGDCPPGMVRVSAGVFRMGSPDGVGRADEHPQHEVTLSGYCIDRTEVTVKAYAECVKARSCTVAPLTVSRSEYSADDMKRFSRFCNGEDRPDHPINCVDWNQAAAYCTWAGKRLPTEAEWEYAARGTDGRAYPWGNEMPAATRLNGCGRECVAMFRREFNMGWAELYDASDGWETTAPVGSFPQGASPSGALDMAGNVGEWTADWYGAYAGSAATNPRGAKTGTARVLRGGTWAGQNTDVIRTAGRFPIGASDRSHGTGFRCVRGD